MRELRCPLLRVILTFERRPLHPRTLRMGPHAVDASLSFPWHVPHWGFVSLHGMFTYENLVTTSPSLNDKVQWTSRDVTGSERPRRLDPNTSPDHSIVGATGDPNNEVSYRCSTFLPIVFVVLSSLDRPESLCPLATSTLNTGTFFSGFLSFISRPESLCPLATSTLNTGAFFSGFFSFTSDQFHQVPASRCIPAAFQASLTSPFGLTLSKVAEAVGAFLIGLQAPWPKEKNKKLRLPPQAAPARWPLLLPPLLLLKLLLPMQKTTLRLPPPNFKPLSLTWRPPLHSIRSAMQVPTMAPTPLTGKEEELPSGKGEKTEATVSAKPSFAGLFSTNRRLTMDNKLSKFQIDEGTITLDSDDLTDVRTKLGFCIVGYIAGKFPCLQAIRTLSKSWGASFQRHDIGWFVFRFARDDDRQRILAGGPYFVYDRPLLLKAMPDCFEFKEDDISLTPVWAILPSLPLECWYPNALGKIGSRLGTPIPMDSLTMRMERVSYARILVEVDASKTLVDHVEFKLPNGVARTQSVVYEYTPKFCTECNRFGHHQNSCRDSQQPASAAATAAAAVGIPAVTKRAATKKALPIEWTLVQRRQKQSRNSRALQPQSRNRNRVMQSQN
ncbi:hypothetical protein Sango_1025200 [Sesamum angolense]|uniref:DUF4283 domain-containing protein n=1 Tax=Sesamum angolense TaxID=2727404 RepID=A0AAE2BZ68_9LAMI|nr:hypothetical protein Sango_1025200 [Sesamum angolense]